MTDDRIQTSAGGEPLAYQSARVGGGRRPWAVSEIFCWAVIVVLTVSLASLIAFRQEEWKPAKPEPNIQLTAACKYIVGIWAAEQQLGQAKPAMAAQLIESVESQAKAPADQVRIAIVYGEFEGPGEAQAHLPNPGSNADIEKDVQTAAHIYIAKSDKTQSPPDAADLARFHERYGWFADLALAQGQPATDPLRERAIGAAYGVLITIVGAVVLALLAALAGLILLIVGSVRLAHGKMGLAFANMLDAESPNQDRRSYLQGFTLYLSMYLVFSIIAGVVLRLLNSADSHLAATVAEMVVLPLAFTLGAIWPFIKGQRAIQWRQTLGLHTGRGIFREIAGGIAGYLAGLPLMAVAFVVMLILLRVSGVTPTHPIEQDLRGSPGMVAFAFFLASVWAPVTEEIMFRGALFASLRERFGWWISAPVMAVVFAAVHPQGWVALPVLAAVAITLAGIREWRGSIIGCMAAHCLHNTALLVFALLLMR